MNTVLYVFISCVFSMDGQSNAPSLREVFGIYKDPNCLLSEKWSDFRTGKAEIDEINFTRDLEICFFGVIYWMIRNRVSFSLLDYVYSSVHPGLLANSDWEISDEKISNFRNFQRPIFFSPHRLKIHVYDPLDYPELQMLTQGSSFCSKGQWGSEVHVHDFFLSNSSNFNENSDFFFVPGYAICMFEGGFLSLVQINDLYVSLLGKLSYWKNNEHRHIFTFSSGLGLNVFKNWKKYLEKSIILTPETGMFNDVFDQVAPDFVIGKDIAIPGHLHRSEIAELLQKNLKTKSYFAVFIGKSDFSRGPHVNSRSTVDVRRALSEFNHPNLFVASNLDPGEMYTIMGSSKFCLVPRGKSAWSLRLYESLWAGCVPVILSDEWILPFHLVESDFAIRIDMNLSGTEEMIRILESVSPSAWDKFVLNGKKVRCMYSYVFDSSFLQEQHIWLDDMLCQNIESAQEMILNQLAETHL